MRSLITLMISTVVFSSSLTAQNAFNTAKMDSLVSYWQEDNSLTGILLLMEKGKIIYQKGIGNAVQKTQNSAAVPNGASTLFRIGSISKTYTASMIMKMVEQGKLKLTDTLAKFYPQIKNADKITMKDLLNHSSGLPNYTNDSNFYANLEKPFTKKQLLQWLSIQKVDFEAGKQQKYSNSNFLILGWILEDLTKKSYEQNLKELITTPLQLQQTFTMVNEPKKDKNLSMSYYYDTAWSRATNSHYSMPGGAGSVVASAENVARFYRNLLQGKIISSSSVEQMKVIENGFGLGLFLTPFYKHKGYGHAGRIDGFNSVASFFPEEDLALVILSNGTNMVLNDAAIGMLSIYFNRPFAIPSIGKSTYSYTTEELQKFVGSYYNNDLKMHIHITLQKNGLIAQATGQSAFPLNAIADNKFEFKAAKLEMDFKGEKNNRTQKLILNQGGMLVTFIRSEEK